MHPTREIAHLVGIAVRYRKLPRLAVSGANLTLVANEMVAITGASGSGKSSFLSVLGLLTTPAAGAYSLLGRDVASASDRVRADLRAQHIGFVFQAYHLLPHMTVLENVLLGARYGRPSLIESRARAALLLERFGLDDRTQAFPRELSGGEQQRVAIARALVAFPALLLCDEPTGNLDRQSAELVMSAIAAGRDEDDRAVVIVTHDPWVASHADRVMELEAPRAS